MQRDVRFLVSLGWCLSLLGCEALWGGQTVPDGANCVTSGARCGTGRYCDTMTQTCRPIPDLVLSSDPADLARPDLGTDLGGTDLGGADLMSGMLRMPLSGLVAPADLRTAVVTTGVSRNSPGLAITAAAWDDLHGNDQAGYNQATGRFVYTAATSTLLFSKKARAACTTGTAPSCTTTGDYADTDYNLFPNDPRLVLRLSSVASIGVRIKQTTLTGFAGHESACGLGFGFGGTGPQANAPDLSRNLKLKAARNNDQLRFLFQGGGTDALQIDLPINGAESIGPIYQNSRYLAPDLDFIRNGQLAEGNSIEYELLITPQLGSGQFALSVTPADVDGDGSVTSNAALQLVAQSAVWTYTDAPDAVGGTGAQPRGGIAFGSSASSITRAEFEGSTIAVGFVASGRGIGSCEFRDLRITAR